MILLMNIIWSNKTFLAKLRIEEMNNMKKLLTILLIFICLASFSQNQNSIKTIKGVVVNMEYSERLPFVNIYGIDELDSLTILSQTDFNGLFSFKFNLEKYQDSIVLKYIGYDDLVIHYSNIKGIISLKIDTSGFIDGEIMLSHWNCFGGRGWIDDGERQELIIYQSDRYFEDQVKQNPRVQLGYSATGKEITVKDLKKAALKNIDNNEYSTVKIKKIIDSHYMNIGATLNEKDIQHMAY